MAHDLSMPDNYGYRHTLRICYMYYFSTARMVTPAHLSVYLCVYDLSCSAIIIASWYRGLDMSLEINPLRISNFLRVTLKNATSIFFEIFIPLTFTMLLSNSILSYDFKFEQRPKKQT